MYRYFAEKYGWSPQVVREMTLSQIAMYFEEGHGVHPKTGRATVKFDSLEEAEDWRCEHGSR